MVGAPWPGDSSCRGGSGTAEDPRDDPGQLGLVDHRLIGRVAGAGWIVFQSLAKLANVGFDRLHVLIGTVAMIVFSLRAWLCSLALIPCLRRRFRINDPTNY